MTVEFLLRRYAAGDEEALKPAVHVLKAMSRGGMYDVVDGGFSRYSVDNFWRVPHFEKKATIKIPWIAVVLPTEPVPTKMVEIEQES